jgi:glycosyltransferase involved in cell wall biosynthesis
MNLRIAYISLDDAGDRRSWSGGIWSMARALEKHAGQVAYLGPVDRRLALKIGRLLAALVHAVTGKRYASHHSLFWARHHARHFQRQLAGRRFDVIFAPVASSIIPFLETDIPVITLSDATFAAMEGYYEDYSDLLASSRRAGHTLERLTLGRSARAVYPSPWAAESAVRDYGIARDRVAVYPFGANLDVPPTREEALERHRGEECRLLFLGRDWERKGGGIALEALGELEQLGYATTLTVVGCRPPEGVSHPRMEVVPFVDKNDPAGRLRFRQILLSTDFLILPTRAECYGYVFAEASAFGVFSFTTDTGGVPGAVADGENGRLLAPSTGGAEWARAIAEQFSDEHRYRQGKIRARDAFEERLNWDAWGRGRPPSCGRCARRERQFPCPANRAKWMEYEFFWLLRA